MDNLFINTNIYSCTQAEFCVNTLKALSGKKVMLMVNTSSVNRYSLQDYLKGLEESCVLTRLNTIPSYPDISDIISILKTYNIKDQDVILSIGGGSAIDTAKICIALSYLQENLEFNKEDILNSISIKEYLKHNPKIGLYAVPTTSGTGSEVTCWATIWDNENKLKYSIEAEYLLPSHAYLVPNFTIHMPIQLTLSSALDSLCHATESYWAKSGNNLVRELSKTAIRLIVKYLPPLLKDESNLFSREKLCIASLYAGLAFSHTRTTACHSISYPLTLHYEIPHGIACTITLVKVFEHNYDNLIEPGELLDSFNAKNLNEIQAWLEDISKDIYSLKLSDYKVKRQDIKLLSQLSFTKGRMDNNPTNLTEIDIEKLLIEVF